jgi:hypothetical protein
MLSSALSLILTPQTKGKGVRLERVQQFRDLLVAVQHKAFRHHIPLERFEVFTADTCKVCSFWWINWGVKGCFLFSVVGTGVCSTLE